MHEMNESISRYLRTIFENDSRMDGEMWKKF